MPARNEVRVTITGDANGLKTALGQSATGLEAFQAKMQAVGQNLRNVGQTMTLGLTLPIVGALGLGVKWAGEMEDAQAMTQQVFGAASADMYAWAEDSARAFGLSSGDATEWANQMGIRLRQIGGQSEQEAARVSQNLVQLAGDFASAFGGSVDEAAQAIGSALTGEFEPLKRYGVVINDVALKNKLFEMTGQEVSGTLTAQQKQMATLALITDQASIVQGDYARNAEGATNSQRTMTAALKDAATSLGTVLLPFVTKAAQFVSDLAAKFQGLDPTIQKVIVIAGVLVAALGPVIYFAGVLATAIGFIASPVGLVVAAIAALVGAFVYFYKTNEGFRNWVNGVVSAVRDRLVAAFNLFKDEVLPQLISAFQTFRDTVLPKVIEAFQWIYDKAKPVFDELGPLVSAALGAVIGFIGTFISQSRAAWETFWPIISAVVENVWPGIKAVIEGALNFIRGIIQVVTGLLSGDWSKAFEGIKNITSGVFQALFGIFRTAAGIFISIIQGLWAVVGPIFSGGLNFLRSVASSIWNAIVSVIQGAVNIVRSVISGIGSFFASVWNGPLTSLANFVRSSFDGIVSFFSGLPGRIRSVFSGLADIIKRPFTAAFDGIRSLWNSTVGGFSFTIPSWVPGGIGGKGFSIPNMFTGGVVQRGGLAMVGELGPEIVKLPTGSKVYPTGYGPANLGGGLTVNVTAGVGDPSEIGRVVVDTIKAYEQRNGTTWRTA